MATVVSLELFKKHCNADDFVADDELLQQKLESAQAHVIRSTRRTEAELTQMGGGVFPAELKQAILLLGAHWYNQRESDAATQTQEVSNTLQALIKPFRKLANDSGEDEV